MLSRSDRGGRDVGVGGFEVDGFVARPQVSNIEPSVADHRRCAGVAGLRAGPSCRPRPTVHGGRCLRADRTDPCRPPRPGHVGSRLIDESDSDARQFARRALRVALEVLDRRRPVAHLGTMADASVVAAVGTLVRGGFVPGCGVGVAVLTRVDVVKVNEIAAELFAAYDRGHRHFALAARITRTRGGSWRLTAIRVR
ncbi:Rv3235 family protein [Nocardia sp. NPDC046473]|uniref:Rv3235 family protein n=1 Tax=Nocardia sp. NPDC046473 TaxID=3155733 RepID=UPI0034107EC2